MFRRKSRGFTIIELLVVISVILILAAIVTPAVHKAKAKAKRVQCLANMRQCGQAALMYAQDYEDTLPTAGDFTAWWLLPGIDDPKYLKQEIRGCPNDPGILPANNYAIYMLTNANIQLQMLGTNDPLICDNGNGNAAWNDAIDWHEAEGGNVFYVAGHAKFLPGAAFPAGGGGMTVRQ